MGYPGPPCEHRFIDTELDRCCVCKWPMRFENVHRNLLVVASIDYPSYQEVSDALVAAGVASDYQRIGR